jgi:hypothetical protein
MNGQPLWTLAAMVLVIVVSLVGAVWSLRREEQGTEKYLTTDDGGRTWRKVAVDVLALTNEEE